MAMATVITMLMAAIGNVKEPAHEAKADQISMMTIMICTGTSMGTISDS